MNLPEAHSEGDTGSGWCASPICWSVVKLPKMWGTPPSGYPKVHWESSPSFVSSAPTATSAHSNLSPPPSHPPVHCPAPPATTPKPLSSSLPSLKSYGPDRTVLLSFFSGPGDIFSQTTVTTTIIMVMAANLSSMLYSRRARSMTLACKIAQLRG